MQNGEDGTCINIDDCNVSQLHVLYYCFCKMQEISVGKYFDMLYAYRVDIRYIHLICSMPIV